MWSLKYFHLHHTFNPFYHYYYVAHRWCHSQELAHPGWFPVLTILSKLKPCLEPNLDMQQRLLLFVPAIHQVSAIFSCTSMLLYSTHPPSAPHLRHLACAWLGRSRFTTAAASCRHATHGSPACSPTTGYQPHSISLHHYSNSLFSCMRTPYCLPRIPYTACY